MDPVVASIVASLVAGAAAAAKDVATSAIKDAYTGMKRLLTTRHQKAASALEEVEADPASELEQKVLAKRLEDSGAGADEDLKVAARALLDAVDQLRNVEAAAPLFDFDRLRVARNLELTDIEAVGGVFRGHDVEVLGDFKAGGIRQTPRDGRSPK